MLFRDIRGLDTVKERLINAVNNEQVAHAQLFLGKPGSPNLPMALAFATYLNCENKGKDDACGECSSCTKNKKFIHPDMHFVFPVSSTKNITGKDVLSMNFMKEWRSFLTENPFGDLNVWTSHYGGEDKQVNISKEESRQIVKSLSLKAFEGKYKVMIIWLPEYMHPASANGILKILEEPPEKTIFILVSSDSEKLLTTILSRTQIVTMPKFTDEDIATILSEAHQVDQQKASELAHLADGDLNQALRLLQSIEDNSHQLFAEWMRDCFKKDYTQLVNRSDQFHGINKVAQKSLLQYALNMLRESLIYEAAPELKRVNGKIDDFVSNFSKVIDGNKADKISSLINEAYYHLERNGSAKMIFLDLSLHIARVIK